MANKNPKYTIAVCHYNMKETVKESLLSIIKQVTEEYEVLVVDDGSDDGSVELLKELESSYECLRLELLEYDPSRHLGETRNISFEKSNGKYILTSLDADDRYSKGIKDFVNIYHQIEEQVDFTFCLNGNSISIAPRDLFLEYKWRNFKRAQDIDFWRRLLHEDKVIWLEHEPFYVIIRDPYGPGQSLRNLINLRVSDFRSGITFRSYIDWCLRSDRMYQAVWRILIGIIAFPLAIKRGCHSLPGELHQMWKFRKEIKKKEVTVPELEKIHNITIERDQLSQRGKELFLNT